MITPCDAQCQAISRDILQTSVCSIFECGEVRRGRALRKAVPRLGIMMAPDGSWLPLWSLSGQCLVRRVSIDLPLVLWLLISVNSCVGRDAKPYCRDWYGLERSQFSNDRRSSNLQVRVKSYCWCSIVLYNCEYNLISRIQITVGRNNNWGIYHCCRVPPGIVYEMYNCAVAN